MFQGDQTFDQGVIAFGDGPSFGHLQVAGNSTVTLGAAVSVRRRNGVVGSGSGFGPRALINRGLIAADQPGGALSVDGAALKNEGVLRAAGGKISVRDTISAANLGWFETTAGQVELNGTLDNTGATLALNDTTGSLFLPQSTVRGGTLIPSGSGTHY